MEMAVVQGDIPNFVSTFPTLALYMSAYMPLAKASLIAGLKDGVGKSTWDEWEGVNTEWIFLNDNPSEILYLNTIIYALSECFQFQVTENPTQIKQEIYWLSCFLKAKGSALSYELVFVLNKALLMENAAFLQESFVSICCMLDNTVSSEDKRESCLDD